MITVRVAARTLPNRHERFLAQLAKEEREVPMRFDGCERFEVYGHPSNPNRVLVYEEWTSSEAFDTYRASDYFRDAGAILFPLMDGAPDSAYYESTRVGPEQAAA